MIQIVHCDQCGGSSIGLDAISVDVSLRKHHHCDKCYHSHEDITNYFFCCFACFLEYCHRVVREEAEFSHDKYRTAKPVQLTKRPVPIKKK